MRISIKSLCLLLVALLVVSGGVDAGTHNKSMRKALALSMLLPGAGQQYLGNHARAEAMYAAEAGVWAAFVCFRIQGDNRKDRYEEMAGLFAGVSGHKDDDYYRALSYYMTSYDYNIDVMREARFRYPLDRDKQLEFFEANALFGDDGWEWQSPEYQSEFARVRTASKQSYRRAVLSTGFAVLNRVVSMIDVYLTFRLADTGNQSFHPRLRADGNGDDGFRVYLSTSF